ncbi:MAG: DUF554 domain-containing protein [Acutalibacteraceae bacterium]|nr:DUF554 domain-containing protein [Acutalibacteraceae bacterium]
MDFLKGIGDTAVGKIIFSGAVVNFLVVIIAGLVGLLLKRGIPERVRNTLMYGMAFCVMYIGITGLFEKGANIIVIIISFALGSILGELIDFDGGINRLGARLQKKLGKGDSLFAEGFVTATLLFCVGAMTVVGSIDSGINGDNSTLYSKTVIDAVSTIALTSTFGVGVLFAAIPVLLIEGGLTLLAAFVSPVLTDNAVTQMSVIGSALIIALSFNMLGITKIKVMNYLPAILLPIILCIFI